MKVKPHLILLAALCVAFILLSEEGVSFGLSSPGLSEDAIRRAWMDFSRNKERAKVPGNYPYMACFEKAARKHQVPLPLLLAVARGESNFDPQARSKKACLGIMQIQWPGTATDLGVTKRSDLFDPCVNIDAGARYLSRLLQKFGGDHYLAVAAYYFGPNAVSPGNVPEKATWYAAYIQRHLNAVLSAPFEKTGRVLILEFTYYEKAVGFVTYLEEQVEGLPLEVFKSRNFTYNVYFTYKTSKEQHTYRQRLIDKTGLKPLDGGRS